MPVGARYAEAGVDLPLLLRSVGDVEEGEDAHAVDVEARPESGGGPSWWRPLLPHDDT